MLGVECKQIVNKLTVVKIVNPLSEKLCRVKNPLKSETTLASRTGVLVAVNHS